MCSLTIKKIGDAVKKTIIAILIFLSPTVTFSQDATETDLGRYIKKLAASDDANSIKNQELWLFRGYACAKEGISIQKCLDGVSARGGEDSLAVLGATKNKLKFDIANRNVELDDGTIISLDQYFDSIGKNNDHK